MEHIFFEGPTHLIRQAREQGKNYNLYTKTETSSLNGRIIQKDTTIGYTPIGLLSIVSYSGFVHGLMELATNMGNKLSTNCNLRLRFFLKVQPYP